ncbi:hypothetical protein [Quadrisphaera sp. KR29]|uniref:hypothetical protein n=1 Tax=Quadrisphaera sp. KR29 TaxID=3461391 RepID=UPI004044E3E5
MASTARHRATTAPLTWAARSLVTATTVPVGALAGCLVAAVATTAAHPALGAAGLAAAGVPLTLSGLRARHRARRGRVRGRHVAGAQQHPLDPAVDAAAPSPAAFRALALAPVAPAGGVAGLHLEDGRDVAEQAGADAVDVVEVARAAERPEAVVLLLPQVIPSQRTEPALERDADRATPVPAPEAARGEVVVHVGAVAGELVVDVEAPASLVAPEQRALEIAQLKRLWAAGTGPDTGSLRAAAPAA